MIPSTLLTCLSLLGISETLAYPSESSYEWNITTITETRGLDEIYHAALKEGGVVTLWHGGATTSQEDYLKKAFESRFPGMTLNVTVDESYHQSQYINNQLANGNVYVDTAMLQTLHDYPRWKKERALLYYRPLGFDALYTPFKDWDGAYYAYTINGWASYWNEDKLNGTAPPLTYNDYLRPEYRNRIVLGYPNDDDGVLFAFFLILREYGREWFQRLLAQNPKWVRGAQASQLIADANSSYAATFTNLPGLVSQSPYNISYPTTGAPFNSVPQYAAIFKQAPHSEAAKLLTSYMLSKEFQNITSTWSVRKDVASPAGYPKIFDQRGTDPTRFAAWMEDRAAVEEFRFWFQSQIGTPQGAEVPWGDWVHGYPEGRSGE